VERSEYSKDIIRDNVDLLKEFREEKHSILGEVKSEAHRSNIYVGALMGCKGDAYKASEVLSTEEAYEFHSWQAELFRKEKVDFLFAGIMPAMPEIIGMAKAMGDTGIPYIISLMIRDNGRLIDGTTIHDAIKTIEETVAVKPITYMTNCVHPTILRRALSQEFNQTELVKTHFKGLQANASPLSPEELDHCCENWQRRC
jgi:S-methylmethionine-dependent homocysteine/selenocysteine methylase